MTIETQSRWALIVLATVAVFAALWVARPVFAPLTLAFIIAIILSPVTDFSRRLGVPAFIGSLLSVALGLAVLTALVLALEPLATSVYEQGPRIKMELRDALTGLKGMMQGLEQVSEEVNKAISPAADAATGGTEKAAEESVLQLSDALFLAPALLGQLMIFIGGLYFFLLCRQDVYLWLARFTRSPDAATIEIFRKADHLVARYSVTIALINAGFGVAVGIALHLLGMPGAMMWGFIGAVMNFIMYLGPAIVAISLAVAGTVVFDGIYSLVPAATFVGLNAIEGQFVTPTLIGQRMKVNPLLVFLSLCLWLWLWGPVGGIVAIPLLVWVIAVAKGLGLHETAVDGTEHQPRLIVDDN